MSKGISTMTRTEIGTMTGKKSEVMTTTTTKIKEQTKGEEQDKAQKRGSAERSRLARRESPSGGTPAEPQSGEAADQVKAPKHFVLSLDRQRGDREPWLGAFARKPRSQPEGAQKTSPAQRRAELSAGRDASLCSSVTDTWARGVRPSACVWTACGRLLDPHR